MCIRLRSHLAETRGSNSRPLPDERPEKAEEDDSGEEDDKDEVEEEEENDGNDDKKEGEEEDKEAFSDRLIAWLCRRRKKMTD